ncbi:hypothetical protein F2Q68_00041725 [Brassica cretica]|uniref:Reverse transcriptase zinc-binding domain-containing protein n=1 Tax=Brassica cretica TaxID=69181 RepID=A0A8S9MH15_BRACR|nr:hypothetical protein F2Q68_00041725 [Brassica cretica]
MGVTWKCGADDYSTSFVAAEAWHLILRDRFATGHRTSKWGQPQVCLYCGEPDETCDHLFFACPYTFTLWIKVVGNLLVPRYAFISWLAVRDRFATGHRTSKWGQPQVCLYCGEPDETCDHLFFACPYTFTLWIKVVGNLLGIDPDPD